MNKIPAIVTSIENVDSMHIVTFEFEGCLPFTRLLGDYLTEWTGLNYPSDVYMDWEKDIIYVAEIGGPYQPKISIRDRNGEEVSSWEGRESEGKGVLEVAHGIWVDSYGDIYEGEIVRNPRLQKFARVR